MSDVWTLVTRGGPWDWSWSLVCRWWEELVWCLLCAGITVSRIVSVSISINVTITVHQLTLLQLESSISNFPNVGSGGKDCSQMPRHVVTGWLCGGKWEGRSVGTICLRSAAPPAMSPSLWISVSPPSARRLNSEQQIESSTNCYHPNDSSLTVFTGYLGSSHISFCFICFGKTLFIYLKYIFWIDFLLNLHRWIDLRSGQWHWKLLSRSTWN